MTPTIALLSAAIKSNVGTLSELLDAGVDINACHPTAGHSALSNACSGDNSSTVQFLLERGANPNLRMNYCSPVTGSREDGLTPVMSSMTGAIVDLLVAHGAIVDAQTDQGVTALMKASSHGRVRVVERLLAAGANPDICDNSGKTAAEYASSLVTKVKISLASTKTFGNERRLQSAQRVLTLLTSSVDRQ